ALTVFRDNGLAMRAMDRQSAEARRSEAESNRLRQALQADIGRVVAAASDGDFSARIGRRFDTDEFDTLAGAVDALMDTVDRGLGETGSVLNALAADDVSPRVEGDYRGAFDRLKTDTNRLADRFGAVVSRMQDSAGALKAVTREIVAGAEDLATRTARQAATVEETAAVMNQLADTVGENAHLAGDALGKTEAASDLARKGGTVMGEANAAMARI